MKPIKFTGDFKTNKELLAAAMGCKPEDDRLKVVALTNGLQDRRALHIAARPGSYVTLQFIHYLLAVERGVDVQESFVGDVVPLNLHACKAFYAELWDDESGKHPTIDWLKRQDTVIAEWTTFAPLGGMQEAIEALAPMETLVQRLTNMTPAEQEFTSMLVEAFFSGLNWGVYRTAEFDQDGRLIVNGWVKLGILLTFRLSDLMLIKGGLCFDKIPSRFDGWDEADFIDSGLRVALGASVRSGSYQERGVILMMNALVNVGSYVGAGTVINSGARVGSCAVIGKNCHIGAGAGLGDMFELPPVSPVMLEDGVFVGPNTEIAEGVIVRKWAVIAGGLTVTTSIDILERQSDGNFTLLQRGEIPEYAVVIGGSWEVGIAAGKKVSKNVLLIINYRDPQTIAEVALEEALRSS